MLNLLIIILFGYVAVLRKWTDKSDREKLNSEQSYEFAMS